MRTPLLILLFTLSSLRLLGAADDPRLATLQAADDARVAAFVAGDAEKLAGVLSDDLRYAHASGNSDSKTTLIEAMTSGKLKYAGINYEERAFSFPAPKVALMYGKVRLQVTTATGPAEIPASYLAVWREEGGKWRFLAWQSAKLPAPAK